MLLKRFTVEGYKNFKSAFVFDLSAPNEYPFNTNCLIKNVVKDAIIYGRNSVGKTNFSHALMDITYHLVDKKRALNIEENYLSVDNGGRDAKFVYEFWVNNGNLQYEYGKKSAYRLVNEELTYNDKLVFRVDYEQGIEDFSHLKEFALDTLNWKLRDRRVSVLRYMANNLQLPDQHPVMKLMSFVNGMLWFCSLGNGNEYVGFSNVIESITDYIVRNGYVGEYEKFLHAYGVNEDVTSYKDSDGRERLYFMHNDFRVPFYAASSGTNALTTFFYWYKQKKELSFLVIDEFDAFYHYEMAEKIVSLLENKFDMQVVLTSHNTDLLSNRIMSPDCYYILNKERIIAFDKATPRELKEGHNLEKLFKSGEFDG